MGDAFYSPVEFGQLAETPTGDLPSADQISLYTKTDGRFYSVNSSGVENLLTNTFLQSPIAADVSIAIVNTGYNGPEIELTQGTWLLFAHVLAGSSTAARDTASARLWDLTEAGTVAQGQAGFAPAATVGVDKYMAMLSMCGIKQVTSGVVTLTLTVYATNAAVVRQYPSVNGVTTVPEAAVTRIDAIRLF